MKSPYDLLSRWKSRYLISFLLLCILAVGFQVAIIHLLHISATSWIFVILVLGIIFIWHYRSFPTIKDACNLLNNESPEMEFSSGMLIREKTPLNTLEQLQLSKLNSRIADIDIKIPFPYKLLAFGLACIIFSGLFSYLILNKPVRINSEIKTLENNEVYALGNEEIDKTQLRNLKIIIRPPAYTHKSSFIQNEGNLSIPEGSEVKWNFDFNKEPTTGNLIIEGKDSFNLLSSKNISKNIFKSSFYSYTYAIDSTQKYSSPYFPIKVTEDKMPEISIKGINEYTRLPFKSNHNIFVDIQVSDDYGLSDAYISATIAKGSGESVKFREKHIPLNNFKKGNRSFKDNHTFSTQDLKMEPGNELYFYIAAKDNCSFENHWVKSLTYFIIIEDTVQYEYADDGGMQVDLMPEFFRSQRQIIIDSEKLLQEKSTIPIKDFNVRSNELGFDQKQLRLKYGQFLGEESESGIAIETNMEEDDHDHETPQGDSQDGKTLDWSKAVLEQFGHDHDHENEAGQRFEENGTIKKEDPTKPSWVEELSHSHDNMEEATYFDMSIQTKLRAALSEMWDSELHLRLYDPSSSLPYQYNALELLQEIKNHARIYVHRIGFDPPPIKESEKRLTGEQKEIINPTASTLITEEDPYNGVRKLISSLSKINDNIQISDLDFLEKFEGAKLNIAVLALADFSLLPLLSDLQKADTDHIINSAEAKKALIDKLTLVLPKNNSEIKGQILRPSSITTSAINKLNSRE